jgi:hypothetical protein
MNTHVLIEETIITGERHRVKDVIIRRLPLTTVKAFHVLLKFIDD